MTVTDNIRNWLATDASDAERTIIDRQLNPPGGALAAINGVVITGPQLRAAIGAIQHIQIRSEADMVRHGMILSAFAQEYGFTPIDYAGAALHARAIALDRWCNLHDPYGQTDVDAFFEAGARAPLIGTPDGVAFEPNAFGELIAFLAELPF
ncbi:MAG: hypothetical protein JWN66_836 [Sphingomonas bacterium]|nr:hypothetical protein [Sphingomonas bacterium]